MTIACNSEPNSSLIKSLFVNLGAPKLDCCPTNLTTFWREEKAIEGRKISLHCSAAGYPELTYRWIFENSTISSDAVLTFRHVSRINEGVYSCKAQNSLGEVTLMINLFVLGKLSV